MKNKMNPTIAIIMLVLALSVLVGCGRKNSAEEAATPVVTADPASPAEPVTSPAVLEEYETPIVSVPSVPPENTVPPTPVAETTPVQAPSQNQESASERFTGVMGTEFIVPEGFIQLDESPSIGYQYTFWHPDYEIRIVVYEIAPGSIPEGAYETDYHIATNNPDVTYFNKGENWFVQSGYNNNGEEIFYSKESSTASGLKTFWITYPTAKREFGDPITVDFEKNCRF